MHCEVSSFVLFFKIRTNPVDNATIREDNKNQSDLQCRDVIATPVWGLI